VTKRISKEHVMDTTNDHAKWFEDVFAILTLVAKTAGLPLPVTSATRACFYFTAIPRARDAREAVTLAQSILAGNLGLTFEPRTALAGDDTERYIIEAYMPSGLAVDIVAKADQMAVAA
jgi:hypothetical protein